MEITNFVIECGKSTGNTHHVSEHFYEIISKICISKTSLDNTQWLKAHKKKPIEVFTMGFNHIEDIINYAGINTY